jgi:DNA-binding response OmpR family regulator
MRALIIEPDETGRCALAAEFETMRIDSIAVGDGAAAMAAFANEAPSLAIVNFDVDGGGLPLIARLQAAARQRRSRLDVFILAERDCPALRAAASQLDIDAVLIRPVERKTLARALAKLLSGRTCDLVVETGNCSSSKGS